MIARRGLRVSTAIGAAAVMVAACTAKTSGSASPSSPATAATVAAPPPSARAAWTGCDGQNGPPGDDCAALQVPLDYGHPQGTKIAIALARKPATGHKIGSLVMNPGGPGYSGIDELDFMASLLSPALRQAFDVVTFDPRGVGRSAPVRCLTGPQLDQYTHVNPAPSDQAGFQVLVAASQQFAQRCQAMSGALLPFVGTVSAARDLDQIRAAVGDAQLSYFGFSYGTFLGATYAELFPTHIRAMVLDGAEDPARDPIANNIEQAKAVDKGLNDFFAYCSSNPTCSWKPAGSPRAAYDALMARITAHPVAAPGGRTLGPGEAFFGVATALNGQQWAQLADGLTQAEAGNGSVLLGFFDAYALRAADGTYANVLESNAAIDCVDAPWPHDPAVLQQAAVTAKQQAPEFGVANLLGALVCTAWPVPPTDKPHAIAATGSPPIVVVGSTADPITPYVDAEALAHQLQHGVLLTRVGDGHTGYRFSTCIQTHVDSYLVGLTVPAAATSCPSN